jgi:hypothetical protein
MRGILRFIFFHMAFWPRLAFRWASLWLTTDYLKVEAIGIDRAFYLEGAWVLIHWKVENAWLVRVNHPGGFYQGSDSTWMSAWPGMPPVRITVYGTRETKHYTFPVHVRPLEKRPAAFHHLHAQLDLRTLAQGPRLRPRTSGILSPRLDLRRDIQPLWPNAAHPSPGMQMQAAVWSARNRDELALVQAAYLGSTSATPIDTPESANPHD